MWNTFDVNVMVNGSRCKQYEHSGRKYIEAKNGSDWYFQIQNNYSGRVLAICSVDGLNVLTGEPATENDTGYIIDAYHSQKIKGFRFSDDEWALFKFGYKVDKSTGAKNEKVYAVSKGGSAEKNCGVIGVKLFYEIPKVVEYVHPTYTHSGSFCSASYSLNASYCITGAMSGQVNWTPGNPVGGLYGEGKFGYTPESLDSTRDDLQAYSGPIACASAGGQSATDRNSLRDRFNRVKATSYNAYTQDNIPKVPEPKPKGFNIGTEWGKKEKSKVEVIDFDRGCEAFHTDIYYASRDSLIEMGVPLSNNIKIGLPQSFANKYATPPAGWVGLL